MNHNELHSFLVGDIRCRAIACKYNVDSFDIFGAHMGLATSSLLLAAGAASGTLSTTQFGPLCSCAAVITMLRLAFDHGFTFYIVGRCPEHLAGHCSTTLGRSQRHVPLATTQTCG